MATAHEVTFGVEVFPARRYAAEAAARIAIALPGEGSVVLTGGTTARGIYGPLAQASAGWGDLDVFFSDERCVPPDDAASNFGMAARRLLDRVTPRAVHRMAGERNPEAAAAEYDAEIRAAVERGLDLAVLGMGADAHVAALFPGSDALRETERLCVAVHRPDGLRGLTLTPPALRSARAVLLVVAGSAKAEAVARVVSGRAGVLECPAALFADHPNVTLLVDEDAAARIETPRPPAE